MKISIKLVNTISSIFFILFISSCSASEPQVNSPQEVFGPDTDYFLGLQLLNDEKENQARQKFQSCMKNGTYFCAKKSAEYLTTMGSLQEKMKACQNLIDMFPDEESYLIAAKQFYDAKEYNKVIELTNNLDLSESDNELLKIRMEAMEKTGSKHYKSEVFKWFISRKISDYHYTFYRDTYSAELPESEKEYSLHQFLITYRIDLYKKDYSLCLEKAQTLFELFDKAHTEPYPLLISDIGKAYLYGSNNYLKNGNLFTELAQEYSNFDSAFYFWFYAGRFYSKLDDHYSQTINCFETAIQNAKNDSQKDDALWYLLQVKINQSYTDTIKNISTYASQWSDPEYFDDLFDTMIPSLMVNGNWKYFGTLLDQIDGYASNETTAKIAYIYGRLLQEGYIKKGKDTDIEIERAFTRALNCGINPYYKILAAYRLGYSDDEMARILCVYADNKDIPVNKSAENLLLGYKYFGYPEKIYPEWQKLYKLGVSTEVSMELAQFLHDCGEWDHDYYPLSIRISARSANITTKFLEKEELKLIYPRFYSDLVTKYASEYEVDENLIYALIRSESFFDEDVESTAGAVGLTQLMQLTGNDIAAKLKVKDFSLLDAETNIRFGTYYISELITRCDGSALQALFSYNAGITRVRRWLSSSMVEFGKKKNMPGDLFLETLPYSETREYGRKLVSASLYYEWLYFDETKSQEKRSFKDIVESFIY